MADAVSTAPSLTSSLKPNFLQRAYQVPLRALNLPDGFRGLHLDNVKDATARSVIQKYGREFADAAEKGLGVFLAGRSGAYKTYSACVLAQAIYNLLTITVDFFDCAKEFPMIDRLWYEGYAQKRMNEANTAPVLIVDDFSQLRTGSRDLVALQEIVNVRYSSKLPTIYTANLVFSSKDWGPLENAVGLQTARRIMERSAGYTAVIN